LAILIAIVPFKLQPFREFGSEEDFVPPLWGKYLNYYFAVYLGDRNIALFFHIAVFEVLGTGVKTFFERL
jgi:hypothetical protein